MEDIPDRTLKPTVAQTSPLGKKGLTAHALLKKKADSVLTAQTRTEQIGPADFFHRRRVPGFASPACPFGWHRQTPKHRHLLRYIDDTTIK